MVSLGRIEAVARVRTKHDLNCPDLAAEVGKTNSVSRR